MLKVSPHPYDLIKRKMEVELFFIRNHLKIYKVPNNIELFFAETKEKSWKKVSIHPQKLSKMIDYCSNEHENILIISGYNTN